MPIRLTPLAAEKVRDLLRRHRLPEDACLRVRIRQGGCSGLSYALNITGGPAEDDEVVQTNGVRVVCDRKSLTWLSETEIDYEETPEPGGFVFHNPNAQNLCNCGNSFGA